MSDCPTLQLGYELLARYGLPDIEYPLRTAALPEAVGNGGEVPFAELLFGLQQSAADGDRDWKALEPALERLGELVAPADEHELVVAEGDAWWVEIGPVDPGGAVVTIQRGDDLLVMMAPREDGRLRIAAVRPLDGKSLRFITGLAATPHPEHGVCMRENNWQYALDASAAMGNVYACDRGEAYLSYWEYGLGVSADGSDVADWGSQRQLRQRRPATVAVELDVHYTLAEDAG